MKGVTEKLLVSVAVWEEWDPDIWRPAFPDLWRTAPPTQRPVFLQDFDHSLNGATPQALHSQKTTTSSPPGLRPQFLQDFDPSLNRTTSLVPTGLQPQFQQDYDLRPNRTTPPVSTGLRPQSQLNYDLGPNRITSLVSIQDYDLSPNSLKIKTIICVQSPPSFCSCSPSPWQCSSLSPFSSSVTLGTVFTRNSIF